jgi:hypothetical protein
MCSFCACMLPDWMCNLPQVFQIHALLTHMRLTQICSFPHIYIHTKMHIYVCMHVFVYACMLHVITNFVTGLVVCHAFSHALTFDSHDALCLASKSRVKALVLQKHAMAKRVHVTCRV